jgi:hypothetical protein
MDNVVSCLECGKQCRDETQLHRHLKAHKMSQGNYYVKHFPRYDKLDGTPIVFKNRDWYFSADFNSRANLREWLEQVSKDEAKDYVRKLLLTRKARKNIVYTPSQVELRSLPMPGMAYMNRLFGDYYAECANLGFVNRFDKVEFSGVWKEFGVEHRMLVDTREQLPLVFSQIKTIHDKLDFGDYKLNDDNFSDKVCIERKSMGDLYSTMTTGQDRFFQEIQRTEQAGFYLIILVEEPFEQLYELSRRMKHLDIVISPEYVMHNVRGLIQKFPMIQFLFVDDRDDASEAIIKILQSNGQCKHLDLQYTYDTLRLCGTSRQSI